MKTINLISEKYFVLLLLLFSTALSLAQPVVRVPPNCNVVVAGTGVGAMTGFGGSVGNGGIVCMPDPFDETSFLGDFNVQTNGTTVLGWRLWGDLSVQTNSTAGSAIQTAGALTTLNIESHNKNVRYAEYPPGNPSSDKKWARSKGRVTLYYLQSPCNSSITFEVYKKYTGVSPSWVPPIVGPDCIQPNTTYTYSVDQIASDNAGDAIGFDSYYWSGIPSGSTNVYTSADNSSITFTTGATVVPSTLSCCYGRCNDWDGDSGGAHTTCVTKSVNVTPTAPVFTSAQPNASCVNTGVTSFPVVLTPIAGYTYTLTATGTPWNIINNSNGNWTVNLGSDNNPGTLTLSVSNGACPPVLFTYAINRNFVAPSASITAPSCITPGTTNNAFSIQTNATLNPTTWTLPAGWTVTAGSANGTNSAFNVTVPAGTAAGAYTITAKSNSCPGTISNVVNVKPATPVFNILSPVCVTRGTTPITSISITAVPGATSYNWTLPAGWTCSANCNTINPTFIPSGTTAGPVTLSVVAVGTGGCNSNAATRTINYSPVAPNSITTSCFNFGVAGTTTVTVANAPSPFFGTYTVSSSPTGLFSTYSVNSTTGVITLNTLATAAGNYTLIITHTTTSCGSSTITFPITVAGNGSSLAITANVPGAGNCDQYNVSGAPPGSTFAWFVNGVQVFNSPTVNIFANTLTLCGNTAPTSVCVNVTSGGCTTRTCAPTVGTHGAKSSSPIENPFDKVKISPNPNNGNFSIRIENFNTSASAVLADLTGKEITSYSLQKGENKITNEGLSSGTYLIVIEIDGKQESRKIVIK